MSHHPRIHITFTTWFLLAIDAIGTGLSYVLGGDKAHSGSSFHYVNQVWSSVHIPWVLVGLALAFSGFLLLFQSTRTVGHGGVALIYLIFALGFFLALFTGRLHGGGGPWHAVVLAAIHLMLFMAEMKARRNTS